MKRRWIAATVLAGQLLAQPAYAWDEIGHEVIARIAWANLTPQARAAAAAILSHAPEDSGLRALRPAGGTLEERRRVFFVEASTWPDIVRDTTFPARVLAYHRSNWHYVNYFFEETPQGPRDRPDLRPDTVNAVERLALLDDWVVDPGRSAAQRATDLAWILHLVGDIHQPLHATARVTGTEPAPRGDLGGNRFRLDGSNLHSYWDGAIRRSFPALPGEREHARVSRIADALMERHPRGALPAAELEPAYEAWARAGFETAKAQAYDTPRGQEPSAEYRAATAATAERAAALAGYRLARLLNSVLAPGA
ncbi:MAG TPA: S1/P1 nuclease [Longimicrobiaceae bacterium]|nr:S1/P1 nuclease [Longimicrobiaceae bacterium]